MPADRYGTEALRRKFQTVSSERERGLLEDDRRLLLAYGSGMRHRDIAAELGITEFAARKRVQRLVDRLAVEFRERCH